MFSVLLSIYHKEKPAFLETALQSVFEQTLLPSEFVVVKDGKLTPEPVTKWFYKKFLRQT
jgi:hypothetical protein